MNHKSTTKFRYIHWFPDDDIEYIEKLRQNKKFKLFRVFKIHNFEANCLQNPYVLFTNWIKKIFLSMGIVL